MNVKDTAIGIIENSIDKKIKRADIIVIAKALHRAKLWSAPKIHDPNIVTFCKALGFKVIGRYIYL